MSTLTQRAAVATYYGKESTFARNVNRMSDAQVLAIYFRLRKEGII